MKMIKHTFTIMILLLVGIQSQAQSPDPVLARVHYIYTNKKDTITKEKTRQENMILFLGKNASLFCSLEKIKHEISEEQKFLAKIATQANNGKPTAFIIDDKDSKWMTNSSILTFKKQNKQFTKEFIAFEAFLIEENLPNLAWKITQDTLSFSGILCQKALVNINNQNWIAWFAPSLPFNNGPAKLSGLPGLIIEAYDENQIEKYKFGGFENAKQGDHIRGVDVTKRSDASPDTYNAIDQMIGRDVGTAYFENMINLPIGAIKTTKPQLEKLKQAYKNDPKGYSKTRYGF